jgi:hypothetical protein
VTVRAGLRRQLVAAWLCLALAACGSMPAATHGPQIDDRVQLLGALPDDAVERGVYVVVPGGDPHRTPSSLLEPMLGGLIAQASLMVETAAPPLTLFAGVPDDVLLPTGARRVGDVVVAGRPTDVEAVEARLAEEAAPRPEHELLAASVAPVAWSGPLPTLHPDDAALGPGRALLELGEEVVRITVQAATPPDRAAGIITRRLTDGSPPGSPGRPWTALLPAAEVVVAEESVVVRARADGLDGRLLRALLDGQALSFLSS